MFFELHHPCPDNGVLQPLCDWLKRHKMIMEASPHRDDDNDIDAIGVEAAWPHKEDQ